MSMPIVLVSEEEQDIKLTAVQPDYNMNSRGSEKLWRNNVSYTMAPPQWTSQQG